MMMCRTFLYGLIFIGRENGISLKDESFNKFKINFLCMLYIMNNIYWKIILLLLFFIIIDHIIMISKWSFHKICREFHCFCKIKFMGGCCIFPVLMITFRTPLCKNDKSTRF